MKRFNLFLICVFLALSLSACGGGGSSTPASSGSSNWDQMHWGQDNWA